MNILPKNKISDLNINRDEFINKIYPAMCPNHQYIPAILPPVHRLLIFGDIHGDYKLLIDMLKIANVISINVTGNILWTGESAYIVQVGDQIDRCRPISNMTCSNPITTYQDEASDIKIMTLCNNLHKQASVKGGAFISLLGNHEILNSSGILTYVSYLGTKEFDNYRDPKNPNVTFKNGSDARAYAFQPGNEVGVMMGCTRLPAVIVGTHLFVHAGIIDGLIAEIGLSEKGDLETINIAIRMWLLGILKKKHIKHIIKSSKTSMFWTRILGNIPPDIDLKNPACINHIGKVLQLFNVNGIIVGHTPQSFTYSDDINQTCSGKVWRVDNGSSSAFHRFDNDLMTSGKIKYSRRPQVLEIIDDKEYYILDGMQRKKVQITSK
jgi:hypothetical protein